MIASGDLNRINEAWTGQWFDLFFGCTVALMTAAYMTRVIWYTFHGEYRGHGTPHESPKVMTFPLLLLAVLTVVIGPLAWHEIMLDPPADVEPAATWGTLQTIEEEHANAGTVLWMAIAAGLLGLVLGWIVFHTQRAKLDARKRPFGALETAFANKFWFDELYDRVLIRPAHGLAAVYRWFDEHVVDGLVNLVGRNGVKTGDASAAHDRGVVDGLVRFVGQAAQQTGAGLSTLQSGRVRLYLSLSVGVLALALLLEALL